MLHLFIRNDVICEILYDCHLIKLSKSMCLCLKTVALAQKTSDATRALAIQEDILEKELGEIQNVLLAISGEITLSAMTDKLNYWGFLTIGS